MNKVKNKLAVNINIKTRGWGGNEIAILGVASELSSLGCCVNIISPADIIDNVNLFFEGKDDAVVVNVACNEKILSSDAEIYVVSDALKIFRSYKVFISVVFGNGWLYFPFWGWEWNKGLLLQLKRFLSRFSIKLFGGKFIYIKHAPDEGTDYFSFPNFNSKSAKKICTEEFSVGLVSVGRIDFKQKAQNILVDSVEAFKNSNINLNLYLKFIGSGPDEQKLKMQASKYPWVIFNSWNSSGICFSDNEICVIGSRFEGLPLVALEALAADVPVIATTTSGLEDVLHPECLYKIDDNNDFSRAILFVLSNKKECISYSSRIVEKKYSKIALRGKLIEWIRLCNM